MAGRTYQLIVAGELSDQLVPVFEGMTLTRAGGTTTLSGHVRDQAELQGLLQRVSDLGLTLLEVKASGGDAANGIVVVTTAPIASSAAAKASGLVLLTLASAQFVMALDTTVMNTAIATVAKDVGTDVTGIQTGDHAVHAGDGVVHDHRRAGSGRSSAASVRSRSGASSTRAGR